jgi:hypothetical protein
MAWSHTVNKTPASGTEAIYWLLKTMSAAGWRAEFSWDATAAADHSANPVVLASSRFSAAEPDVYAASGANTLKNNRAGIVMKAPGDVATFRRRLILWRGDDDESWRASWVVGGDATTFDGGTGTATRPPDLAAGWSEVLVRGWGGGSFGAPTFGTVFQTAAAQPIRCHAGVDQATPYGLWFECPKNGGGADAVEAALIVDPMEANSYNAAEKDPYVILSAVTGDAASGLSEAGLSDNNYAPKGYLGKTAQGNGTWSVIHAGRLVFGAAGARSAVRGLGQSHVAALDDHPAVWYARHNSLGGTTGLKGKGTVVRWLGADKANGDLVTVGGVEYKVCNDLLVRWETGTAVTL